MWCHTHGCVTHSTANCYARRNRTRPQPARTNQATAISEESLSDETEHELSERLQFLENVIAEQQDTTDGTQSFILDSGANLTHTATSHANMHGSTGPLTQTATGHRARITHTGNITINTKNDSIQIAAVHTAD